VWSNTGNLYVGHSGPSCSLVVSNGAKVNSSVGELGLFASSSNNQAWVTGPGSVWTNRVSLLVGLNGSGNLLVVSNGGAIFSGDGVLGGNASSTNNMVWVTGVGSVWAAFEDFGVGANGSGNLLVITNGGTVVASNSFGLGSASTATNNRAVVDGGVLRVTNSANSGVLDVRGGTNVINAGFIEVDRLLVTNTLGDFELHGGFLKTESTTNNNGRTFFVGNGTDEASILFAGNGVHHFANGITVRSNTVLAGNGTVVGTVTVLSGSQAFPGAFVGDVGKLVLNTSPVLQGLTLMDISKNGSTLTNDQIQVTAPLSYGGTLFVNKIGPTALSAGDQFSLFSASSYSGSFSAITLPALGAGLTWTNKLLANGSIQVVSSAGVQFSSITLSGTNVIFNGSGGPSNATYWVLASTNVALPLANWTRILTNQFNAGGSFTFTNAVTPAVPQRFYLLQVP
jgi:T5SS/PEP-CTERM-associated repeat protein